MPVSLQLILSDLCNHDCHFCAYRASGGLSVERFGEGGEKNPNRMLTFGKAMEILSDAADCGVKSVIFTGGGEPTVHPHHLELFEFALNLGLECSLNTNGVVFRKGWERVLPRFAYVRFSVDAGNAREYAEVRGCPEGHYERMLANMRSLASEILIQGTDCVLGAGYVVTPANWVNLVEGVTVLRESGSRYVRLAAMQSVEGRSAYRGKWDDAREAAKLAGELATDEFAVHDLMEGVVGERPDYEFCGFQHFVLYVGGNLEVYRCCYTAYTDHGLVGSLKDQTLAEYLATDRRGDGFDARSCAVCPLNEKNRAINSVVDPDPLHVNFV